MAPYRTEIVWVDPIRDIAPDAIAAESISHTLFVNRCPGGCTITGGTPNDSRTNTSSIVRGTKEVQAFTGSADTFAAVIACLRDVYGPYDVDIVTEDPGDALHHEAILAGTPGDVGQAANIGGIAPASCEPLDNVISFSFGNLQPTNVEELCWTVAQESAHSFGLPNHVFDCTDPMTYLGPSSGFDCGRKYFRNKDLPCGEFEERPCTCDNNADGQNSHAALLEAFGPGTAPPATEVAIITPLDDATVNENFTIFFTASNTRIVDRLELWLNGSRYDRQPGYDFDRRFDAYDFTVPDVPDGYIDVEIRAFDDIGTEGSSVVTVLKGEPCTSDDTCVEFQSCAEGRCSYPPPVGLLGDECAYPQVCLEGDCTDHDGDRRCAVACDADDDDPCPDGFQCDQGRCFPADGGGCCSIVGARERDAFPLVGLGLFALGFVALRRRSSST